jgi:hypothetical protein
MQIAMPLAVGWPIAAFSCERGGTVAGEEVDRA